ncbi:MAG TPA: hypothetical protein VN915_07050 [Elusimicrobiota bacterium]|nr:hypothetical protein [Elusimicrobiota bacterium]
MKRPALTALLFLAAAASAQTSARPPLGASWPAEKGGFAGAQARVEELKSLGFRQVSLVPTYAYPGLNRIDFASGPDEDEVAGAAALALADGFTVVLKPHLDPPAYFPGYDAYNGPQRSWRADCPWRGFFDVDPMSEDYRGLIRLSLEEVSRALARQKGPVPPVRLELGVELMDSVVAAPGRWLDLLAFAREERRRLGLDGKVLLSHNFAHHIEIPEDVVLRLDPKGRKALARYIKGLDALALSQYMDLTAATPAEELKRRLPTADEVAAALALHDAAFRRDVLEKLLGLRLSEIPPIHIGEFGVGRGGLKHPNVWAGDASPEEEKALDAEIARGYEGLARYLATPSPTRAFSATLWVTGKHYDVFGWQNSSYAIPAAADAAKAYLSGR